jgi:hypothetical protein
MGLMIEQEGAFEEYEAVALPTAPGVPAGTVGAAVFLRRSPRPSRRAVLHLHDLTGSFAPADLARWYNERGFHFYVTDFDMSALDAGTRRRRARTVRACFATLDSACRHLREADGIDAIVLSADDEAAAPAALWCHARRAAGPVTALILSNPDFGRGLKARLDITCPVLVIAASGEERAAAGGARKARANGAIRLGQHVTWLYLDGVPATGRVSASHLPVLDPEAPAAGRRRLFDEMGRWLGAYMYGKARDQLL